MFDIPNVPINNYSEHPVDEWAIASHLVDTSRALWLHMKSPQKDVIQMVHSLSLQNDTLTYMRLNYVVKKYLEVLHYHPFATTWIAINLIHPNYEVVSKALYGVHPDAPVCVKNIEVWSKFIQHPTIIQAHRMQCGNYVLKDLARCRMLVIPEARGILMIFDDCR